jgi:hypothetical protein
MAILASKTDAWAGFHSSIGQIGLNPVRSEPDKQSATKFDRLLRQKEALCSILNG